MKKGGDQMKDERNIEGKGTFTKALASMAALALAFLITLTSCVSQSTGDTNNSGANKEANTVSAEPTSSASASTEMFTDRDLSADYDESSAVKVELSGSSAKTSANDGVSVDGGTITITKEGTYIVSGTLSDGQIIVESDDTAKVQIVLNGASITSKTSAAIYVKSADKVFVTTAKGTQNTLANGGSFTADGDTNIDGAVFGKDDITFNGEGNLTVESPAGHGIVGKDDIKLAGGAITINAARHGVQANDSVRIADATINIEAGKEGIESLLVYICGGDIKIKATDDGINATNSDNTSQNGGTDGQIQIEGGKIYVSAGGDGIDSNGALTISGGYTVVCGPSQGDTSVLDCNGEAKISGGTFIGTGGAGMAQSFSSVENQGLIAVSVGNQSAGTKVSLKDSSGKTITEVTPELDFAVVYISTPDMAKGSTYTLEAGSYSESIELTENAYSTLGGGMGGRGGKGGMKGDMSDDTNGKRPQGMPQDGQADGERPQGMPQDGQMKGPKGGGKGMKGGPHENQDNSTGTGV